MQIRAGIWGLVALLPLLSAAAKNSKRGLCFADSAHPEDIAAATQSSSVLTWVYDWGTTAPSNLASSGLTYVPMQWGSSGAADFQAKVLASGAKTILAFNEPDFASQSNIDPTTAAQLWKEYIEPLKAHGIRLGGPAVTSAPSGRPWLASFLSACTGCSIDFLPLHWYGDGLGPFYDYIWAFHGQFPNHPVWVTEYASTSSDDAVVLDFLKQSVAYLDTLDWVERYAWFAEFRADGTSHYNLLDANGQLNALGKAYVNNA